MKINTFPLVIFIAALSAFFNCESSHAKNYRILVLPSGGATGIIPVTLLTHLEQVTQKPTYQHFDEIWSSSIGAMTAALLTTPQPDRSGAPLSAQEVSGFIEKTFSQYHSVLGIRGQFRTLLPSDMTLGQTLIPIRVMSAEVLSWYTQCWPRETRLKEFSRDSHSEVLLSSIACSSCTVFPFHPTAEKVKIDDDCTLHCIDAGSEVCSSCSMNPLFHLVKQFSESIDPTQDQVSVYFLSNGWVRMHPSWGTMGTVRIPISDAKMLPVTLFNIDVELDSAFQEWKNTTLSGKSFKSAADFFPSINSPYLLENLAGFGAIPTSLLKDRANHVIRESAPFRTMVEQMSPQLPQL